MLYYYLAFFVGATVGFLVASLLRVSRPAPATSDGGPGHVRVTFDRPDAQRPVRATFQRFTDAQLEVHAGFKCGPDCGICSGLLPRNTPTGRGW
jgi:hypothetical protein